MRNPFVLMALAAAAVRDAFRSAAVPNMQDNARPRHGKAFGRQRKNSGDVARKIAAGRATCRHGKPYHTKQGIAFLAAQERAATR